MQRPAGEQYLGILGPVLRVAVGDTVTVVFRNALPFNASIMPLGLKAQASGYAGNQSSLAPQLTRPVPPNATTTYRWLVPPSAGPAAGEPETKLWLYRCGCGCG